MFLLDLDYLLAPCTYLTAHKRVWREKGPAKNFDCVDCGGQALHWSYEGGSPFEQSGTIRQRRVGGKVGKRKPMWTDDDLDKLAALDGMTVAQQAAHLGVSPSTVDRMRRALRARHALTPKITCSRLCRHI